MTSCLDDVLARVNRMEDRVDALCVRKDAPDYTKLSEARLRATYEKAQAKTSAIVSKLINAGYGNERGSETRARARSTNDPLAASFVNEWDIFQNIVDEMESRRRWHGSLKPIKRRF
jgi:hypothetical protein